MFAILNIRKIKPTIIGHQKWLETKIINNDTLERLHVQITMPFYIDYHSKKYKEFRLEYFDLYKEVPDKFSHIGYELMLYFGNCLHKYGTYFQKSWTQEPTFNQGISQGIYYGRFSSNQNVKLGQVIDGLIKIDENIPNLNYYGQK